MSGVFVSRVRKAHPYTRLCKIKSASGYKVFLLLKISFVKHPTRLIYCNQQLESCQPENQLIAYHISMTEISKNLTELIKRSKKMQKDIAAEIGVSRQAITDYARGHRCPPAEKIKKLCKALDCSYEDLLGSIE